MASGLNLISFTVDVHRQIIFIRLVSFVENRGSMTAHIAGKVHCLQIGKKVEVIRQVEILHEVLLQGAISSALYSDFLFWPRQSIGFGYRTLSWPITPIYRSYVCYRTLGSTAGIMLCKTKGVPRPLPMYWIGESLIGQYDLKLKQRGCNTDLNTRWIVVHCLLRMVVDKPSTWLFKLEATVNTETLASNTWKDDGGFKRTVWMLGWRPGYIG